MASKLNSFNLNGNSNPFVNPIGKVQAQLQTGSTAQTTVKPYGQGDYQALTNSLQSINGSGSGRSNSSGNGGIVASTNKPFNFGSNSTNQGSGLNGNTIGRKSQVVPTGNRMSFANTNTSPNRSGQLTQRDLWQSNLMQQTMDSSRQQQDKVNDTIKQQQDRQMTFEEQKSQRESRLQSSQFNAQLGQSSKEFDVTAAQRKLDAKRQFTIDQQRTDNEKLIGFQNARANKQAALGSMLSAMRPTPM